MITIFIGMSSFYLFNRFCIYNFNQREKNDKQFIDENLKMF